MDAKKIKTLKVSALRAIRLAMEYRMHMYPYPPAERLDLIKRMWAGEKFSKDGWLSDMFATVCTELLIGQAEYDALYDHFFKKD